MVRAEVAAIDWRTGQVELLGNWTTILYREAQFMTTHSYAVFKYLGDDFRICVVDEQSPFHQHAIRLWHDLTWGLVALALIGTEPHCWSMIDDGMSSVLHLMDEDCDRENIATALANQFDIRSDWLWMLLEKNIDNWRTMIGSSQALTTFIAYINRNPSDGSKYGLQLIVSSDMLMRISYVLFNKPTNDILVTRMISPDRED